METMVLKHVSLFSSLDEQALSILVEKMVARSFPKNAILINEGDESDSMYVILAGKVKVFSRDENGKEVIINFQGEGEYFGELSLLDGHTRSVSVMTIENSKFGVIAKPDFDQILAHHPHIALKLIKQLSERLRALTENVKSLALMDVYGRVAKTLLEMAEPGEGDKRVIKQKLTQQDIANIVGASREMVTRIIKDLTVGGYIDIQGKTITINSRLPHAW